MRQLFYYKMRQKFVTMCIGFLLQIGTLLLQNAAVIAKYEVYYKTRWYIPRDLFILLKSLG